jgi:hypothetical protein
MQQPRMKPLDFSSSARGTDQREGCLRGDDIERMVERVVQPGALGREFPGGGETTGQLLGEFDHAGDEFESEPEVTPVDCVGYISRGIARYQRGDPECEADYRAAFRLDAAIAASEVVQRLEEDIRDDVADVLLKCRTRLSINPHDLVARTRLGLTSFLLYRDAEAFSDLQRVFLQDPVWRPFLRLLVNEAKPRRTTVFARLLQNP